MKLPRFSLSLVTVMACVAALRADVTVASLFVDHAVLQRDKPVPVWGRANPGETVTIAFAGQRVAATAGPDGRWLAWLAPLPANPAGADLVVAGKNTLALHDVLVGDVWLCSGQSNMEFSVRGPGLKVMNSALEVAAANYPLIRQFKVAKFESDAPVDPAPSVWEVCSPATAGHFTAVGYFFAREIHRKLGIPIGLINSSWGGTRIEAWIGSEALAKDPAFALVAKRWEGTLALYPKRHADYLVARAAWDKAHPGATVGAPPAPQGPHMPDTPAGLFNGMIHPLLPYAIRGMLWYQGEANVGRAYEYHRIFAAMIADWRAQFGQGDLPFYWVQLANFAQDNDPTHQIWAFLREAQTQTLSLPNTGQAVSIDIGDPQNIHPTNKQEVGRRLALIARAKVYDIPGDFSGPVFAGATTEGRLMRVRFTYAENGLTAAGKPLQSFEVAGADRQFHPATAVIAGDTLIVQSPQVPAPIAVRYAWSNAPEANLYNGAGLPACPFRSDHW